IPAQPPALPSPSSSAPALPNVQDFIRASWRHYASNNPTAWAADFAPSVNYCYYDGTGAADRSYVELDRAKLLTSYPTRHYEFSGLTTQMDPNRDSARVHYTYHYSYNGKKAASGTARVSLTVQLIDGGWSITDFNETVNRD